MQQRMTFVDNWNTLEQVCLASAVRTFGDTNTNWSAVCNFIRNKFSLIERPGNWLTPESCEAQYKWLIDKYVKMEISCELPVNQILENLKQIGKQECLCILEQEKKYKESREKIELFARNEIDYDTAMVYYEEAFKRNREREENVKKQGLKNDQPNVSKSLVKQDNKIDGSSPITTSPLLSSLLNNPPAVQYRPTLSTASFIPAKATQGTSRTSLDRAHTPEIGHRSTYSPNLGSQSSPLNERSGLISSSTSPARKLDFQDSSTCSPTASNELLLIVKDTNKDLNVSNETAVKSNIHSLENISLLPANEEYLSEADIPQEMILQVIGNLEGKQLLDKVLDELTSEKDTISEKDLTTVSIPLDEPFVSNSVSNKNAMPIVNLPSESRANMVLDPSLMRSEFESCRHEYETTQDVIIINEGQNNEHVLDNSNISSVEQPTLIETVTIDAKTSSFSPVKAVSSASESISEPKSESEPLVEYLNVSAVEMKDNTNWQAVENIEISEEINSKAVLKVDLSHANVVEFNNVVDKSRESTESYETCESIPELSETSDTSAKKSFAEVADVDEQVTLKYEGGEVIVNKSEARETTLVEDISFRNIESDDISLQMVETKIDSNSDLRHENAINESVSENVVVKTTSEDKETEDSNVRSSAMSAVVEDVKSNVMEEESNKMKPSSPIEVVESHEEAKPSSAVKNRRKPTRRRRSTITELNEVTKPVPVSEESERVVKEEVDANKFSDTKEINITIKDFQTAGLDAEITEELLKPKEEVVEVPAQIIQAKSKNEKPTSKSMDMRKERSKPSITRRSSVRTQNLNTSTRSGDVSPSTSWSRTTDSTALKKSLVLVQQNLATQKYSSAFLKPPGIPGYENVIYSPQDLHGIKRKIENRVITSMTELQRDVLLLILNAKMFNAINSQVYNMAVEIQKEALKDIQLNVQILNEGVLFDMDDASEKARKRQSVQNVKKEQRMTSKRKPSTKDESTPAKKIKLEENETNA